MQNRCKYRTVDPELAGCVAADGRSLAYKSLRTHDFLGKYNTSCNCMPAQVTQTPFMETGHPADCAACDRGSSRKRSKSMAGVKGPFEAAPKGIWRLSTCLTTVQAMLHMPDPGARRKVARHAGRAYRWRRGKDGGAAGDGLSRDGLSRDGLHRGDCHLGGLDLLLQCVHLRGIGHITQAGHRDADENTYIMSEFKK